MRMLRQVNGNMRTQRIHNEESRLKMGVSSIDEKMKESHLRWFGHVQRKTIDGLVRKSELIQVEGMRKGRVWPKTTLVIAVIKYVSIKEMTKNMSLDCGGK